MTKDDMFEYIKSLIPVIDRDYTKWLRTDNITEPDNGNVPESMLKPFDYSKPIDWQAVVIIADYITALSSETNDIPWIALTGSTGLGKTRTAVMTAVLLGPEGYVESPSSPRFLSAKAFEREAKVWRNGKPIELTGVDEDDGYGIYYHMPLVLDDLGLVNFSKTVIDALYEVIVESENNSRPLIITSQIWGTALYNAMLGKTPDAQHVAKVDTIMRRLDEHCRVFNLTSPRQVDWDALKAERKEKERQEQIEWAKQQLDEGSMNQDQYKMYMARHNLRTD